MSLSFKHKVFLTLLLNSLAMVVSMLLIAEYYASRNFEEYVLKVERKQVDELVGWLSREYGKTGSWETLLDHPAHWQEMVGIRHEPPAPRGEPAHRPPPPPPLLPGPGSSLGPPERGAMPENPGGPAATGLLPPPARPLRMALFDDRREPLGRSELESTEGYQLKPIQVEGRIVGYLGVREHEHPAHPLDVEYLRLQARTFASIGVVALALAVLVTWALSRHLLAPVRELALGTRALTSRRFETRVEVRSGDELGQLAADFNDMAQALERYEQMRRQWIADISHELRTPLAILRGEIEAMLDGVRELTREALESLHFEVMHVSRIVHDLHDLSIIESDTFHTSLLPVDPLEVLNETLKSFQTRFEQRRITLSVAEKPAGPLFVLADSDRLRQLFANLLENTLRYASAPGELRVEQTGLGDQVHLVFEDSGPGVPEEALAHLFDRLYRVDKARSRARGGSGLGLAICRGIVESFGGRIEASNGAGGGLRISIQLPAYVQGAH